MTDDLIGRSEAQTAIQFAARRYTVAHEAHGEGRVVWSDNLISVTDAMNVLRDLPSAQPETNCSEIPNNSDTIYRQQAIDFVGSMNMCDEISNEAYKKLTSYLDELSSAEPYTTTHDSIPAETGGNDDDRTSGDCISRQQAIDEIHEDAEWLASQGSDWQVERMERDKSILMSLPSVQPEREKGEWVYNSPVTMKCNRCGLVIKDWDWHRFKICPNCGADMRGEKDG